MALGEVLIDGPLGVVAALGQIGLFLQALGIVVIVLLVFEFITFFINRKRIREIRHIREDMVRIEGKINAIARKVKA